jgi:MYXO-CTERM domain-containing protein
VQPGGWGIGIASGHDIEFSDNKIYSSQTSISNVGGYVWNQYAYACTGHTVSGNIINWTNDAGTPNHFWDGGNCGSIAGLATNQLGASVDDTIWNDPLPACGAGPDAGPPKPDLPNPLDHKASKEQPARKDTPAAPVDGASRAERSPAERGSGTDAPVAREEGARSDGAHGNRLESGCGCTVVDDPATAPALLALLALALIRRRAS